MRNIIALNTYKKPKSTAKVSDSPVLSRLIGIETEYAFRYADGKHRNSHLLYHAIVASVAHRMPLVQSLRNPNRCFLANGGSISWEPVRTTLSEYTGFVETATPQCKRPKQVVAYSTAFDHLITEALLDPFAVGREQLPFSAIRNSSDAFGRSYGQQENYEVEIASGTWLWLWRLGLLLLFPLLLCHRVIAKTILILTLGSTFLRTRKNNGEDESFSPQNFCSFRIRAAAKMLEACHAPLEFMFAQLCRCTLLKKQKNALGTFLASRVIMDGGGHVDKYGCFWLSARAQQVTDYIGFSGDGIKKPIIDLSHWFRSLCLDDTSGFVAYRKLFGKRQRLQLCCGDTSTNELVRWIQIGSTCLVLDMIEAGFLKDCPKIRNCERMLRRFARDSNLDFEAVDSKGRKWSALALQDYFVKHARRFLHANKRTPSEAWEILNAWQLMLSRLQSRHTDPKDSQWLIARSDWYTKQTILRHLPANASFATRKKVDIRYHEVGVEGYYQRIARQREIVPLIDRQNLDRATRMPPDGTPATKRGYLIREFAGSDQALYVDWDDTWLHPRK